MAIKKTFVFDCNTIELDGGSSDGILHNGKTVSQIFNWAGATHRFTALENGQEVHYEIIHKEGIFTGYRWEIRRNGQLLYSDLMKGAAQYKPAIYMAVVILIVVSAYYSVRRFMVENDKNPAQVGSDPEIARLAKYKEAIKSVDQKMGEIDSRNKLSAKEKYISATSYFDRTVSELRQIDQKDCPADFKEAFLEFVHAWQHRRDVEDQNTGVKGVIKTLSGNLNHIQQMEAANKSIMDALSKLERVALKYGVTATNFR